MDMGRWPYWVLVFALVGFGSVAIFSIGAPFLLLGLTLAVLAPFRTQRRVFWPVLFGVVGFVVGYVLVSPLSCTSTTAGSAVLGGHHQVNLSSSETVCSSVLGFDYRGGGSYHPPLWPGLAAGAALAAGGAVATRFVVRNRERPATLGDLTAPG